MSGKITREYYMDYRFIVRAGDWQSFIDKIVEFLPDATDDIWYTEIQSGMMKDSGFIEKNESDKHES